MKILVVDVGGTHRFASNRQSVDILEPSVSDLSKYDLVKVECQSLE
jgi:hypothetical protein